MSHTTARIPRTVTHQPDTTTGGHFYMAQRGPAKGLHTGKQADTVHRENADLLDLAMPEAIDPESLCSFSFGGLLVSCK